MDEKPDDVPQGDPAESQRPRKPVTHLRARIEEALDWLEGAGLGFGWAERVVYWLKHLGPVKMLGVFIAVALPLAKYVWVPAIASRTVSTIAEGYGVEIEVEDWSGELFDLRATAKGVSVDARGAYAREELFYADSVTLDLSVWRRITKGQWIDEISFERPSLYAERLLSGRWNLQDAIKPASASRPPAKVLLAGAGDLDVDRDASEGADSWSLSVPVLRMNNLRIQWVENLPSRSGGGVVQSTKATIFVDDVTFTARNYYRPSTSGEGPLEFSVEGRTADGRISLNGLLNPYGTEVDLGRVLLVAQPQRSEPPLIATSIYLENIGVATISALTHQAWLVPATGTVTGTIDLAIYDSSVDCAADVVLANVTWTVAERAREAGSRMAVLTGALEGLRADGRVRAQCDGSLDNEDYRPLYAIQGALTSKALEQAPPTVRALAKVDQMQLSGEAAGMTPDQVKRVISAEVRLAGIEAVRARLGDDAARIVDQAVPQDVRNLEPDAGNPLSRGWKRLRTGWKKIRS